MEERIVHLAGVPRRHPGALPVAHQGFHPGKRYRVRHGFRSCNFSFILSGSGTYRFQGRLIPVQAPCVLTQWPGLACDYGPTGSWDELFVIYAATAQSELTRCGFLDPSRPLWHLGSNQLTPLLLELEQLAGQPQADRIDRVCERLVLESLLTAQPGDAPADDIARIRALVEADCLAEHDFAKLAQDAGLSLAHFRRLWQRAVGCPPARYVMGLRLALACRLLVSGEQPVHQVAAAAGFSDPLHFSRRFRDHLGESPSQYRERFRP